MAQPIDIIPIVLLETDMTALASDARREGFPFIDRLTAEWASGPNRFDRPGEMLLAACRSSELVGIGGLNRDPVSTLRRCGRIRHVYVRPDCRNIGVGKRIMQAPLQRAATNFDRVRLRTDTTAAAAFHLAIGFASSRDPVATHEKMLT